MRIRLLAAAIAALALAGPTAAHHGWMGYEDAEFSLTGVVESANLGGPHGLLRVRAGRAVWDVVLAPPTRIQRAGLALGAVPRGTRVTARGHRHRDHRRMEMKTERLVVGARTFDLYPERS
ncbi:MAG TPA: DUF6152 family protein [Allosphingosinicella sp.]|nr:DUF6152 family protein [Allosphingosinicella sp.]